MTAASEIVKWIIVALIAIGALRMIANIGKAVRPTKPGDVATIVLFDAALIVLIVVFWRYGS